MAKETIDVIRAAEKEAEELIRSAVYESERIITNAKSLANEIYEKMISDALKEAEDRIKKSEEKGRLIINEALKEAETEIKTLQNKAKAKEEEIIELILSEIV